MTAWATAEQEVAPGTWDLRLNYDEGPICKADGWIRNVSIQAGKLWKVEVVLAGPMHYVYIFATLGGKDVADNAHVDVFKAGTEEEFGPILRLWSTQKQAVAAGNYDLRLSYEKDQVKAKGGLKGLAVGAHQGIQKKTIALKVVSQLARAPCWPFAYVPRLLQKCKAIANTTPPGMLARKNHRASGTSIRVRIIITAPQSSPTQPSTGILSILIPGCIFIPSSSS